MVELVKFLVENLVDDKEAIVITEENDTVKISVARSDMGKIIGRQGKIAKAIRTVVKAASIKSGKKYSVEILEADESFIKADNDSISEKSSDDDFVAEEE